jgi:nucleoside-diphosphate kinase
VAAGKAGEILAHLEKDGFRLVALKKARLAPEQARAFYAVHRERPFFEGLIRFMTEGPVIVAALERQDAVAHLRRTMGATDSRKAEAGTIRNLYGTDIERNAIHGSDSPENAAREVAFFFGEAELI